MARNAKSPTVVHYRSGCIGCGSCALVCPNNWKMSEKDGLADLIDGEVKKDTVQKQIFVEDLEENKLAAQLCPVNVIKVND